MYSACSPVRKTFCLHQISYTGDFDESLKRGAVGSDDIHYGLYFTINITKLSLTTIILITVSFLRRR